MATNRILFTEELVDPKKAKLYMAKNHPNNRKISMDKVDAYARDIRAGNWRLTHQGIAFDEKGNLIDGQHRLCAIIKANYAIWMEVARYQVESSMVAVDRGKARTVRDALTIALGRDKVPHLISIAFARNFNNVILGGSETLTDQEVMKFMEIYPELFKALDYIRSGNTHLTAPVSTACVCAIINGLSAQTCKDFCQTVYMNTVFDGKGYNHKAALDYRDASRGKTRMMSPSGRAQMVIFAKTALHMYATGKVRLLDRDIDRYPVTIDKVTAFKFEPPTIA